MHANGKDPLLDEARGLSWRNFVVGHVGQSFRKKFLRLDIW